MTQNGYALIDSEGTIINTWSWIPPLIIWPNGDHTQPGCLCSHLQWKLVESWRDDQGPETRSKKFGDPVTSFDGTKIIITRTLVDRTSDEIAANIAARKDAIKAQVMDLRLEKIEGGMTFNSVPFQTRADDQTNIAGAVLQATMFEVGGGSPDSLRWHGGASDFVWIAADNSLVPMSVTTVQNFGKEVAAHKSACIFRAYALKAAIDSAADDAALDAIDITAGWPS